MMLYVVCVFPVAHGRIDTVFHDMASLETEVRIDATKVLRQRHKIFKKVQHPDVMEDVLMMSHGAQYKGAVYFPHKCGIRKGEGQFLFIGKVRLGRAQLRCAPRMEDFEAMWKQAVQEARNLCLLD